MNTYQVTPYNGKYAVYDSVTRCYTVHRCGIVWLQKANDSQSQTVKRQPWNELAQLISNHNQSFFYDPKI